MTRATADLASIIAGECHRAGRGRAGEYHQVLCQMCCWDSQPQFVEAFMCPALVAVAVVEMTD